MSLDLTNATVIGYFSMPSASLAEANPSAYNTAMAGMPKGAGSCAHCGTGILHHVIIQTPEGRFFIGTTCAEKVGCERVRACVRQNLTEAQMLEREAKAEAFQKSLRESEAKEQARKDARAERFTAEITALHAQGTQFHDSLADALRSGPLSYKQTMYAVKAILGRESKKRVAEFDAMYEKLQAE